MTMKRIVSLLLVLAMTLCLIPAAFAEENTDDLGNVFDEGKLADTINYYYSFYAEDGSAMLSIQGTGKEILTKEMLASAQWQERLGTIQQLYVEDLSGIEAGVFEGLKDLQMVNIYRVKTVGERAFADTGLAGAYLAYGVEHICAEAFAGCTMTWGPTISFSVKEIGAGAFKDLAMGEDGYIFFEGQQSHWEAITVGDDNDALLNARIEFADPAECYHGEIVIGKVQPTDTAAGYSGDRLCIYCGTVTLKGMDVPALKNPFSDVSSTAFYHNAVRWAYATGVTSGITATSFQPNATCTRGQVVTFLWRAAGKPKAASATNPFSDVKKGAFYYDAVLWAVEQGITSGTSATTFEPDATVKREQFVTFMWRAAGKPEVWTPSPFTDVANENAYYYDAVVWAVSSGVTSGVGAGVFGPAEGCTRGQTVTFLERYYMNAPLSKINAIGVHDFYVEVADHYYKDGDLHYWLDSYLYPTTDPDVDYDKIKLTPKGSGLSISEEGYVIAKPGATGTVTVSYDNVSTDVEFGPYDISVSSYFHADQVHWNKFAITKFFDFYGGTYINSKGELCVITQFWVQGYNALGGQITKCMQTLHNLDTGEEIHQPEEWYEAQADRYFGAARIEMMELAIEYQSLLTSLDHFPQYYVNEYGLHVKR